MTDPLITMAEQPPQASCEESSRRCPAASYRQTVENGQGGIGIAFQRPNRIPRLRPRLQTKVALQVSMPGFAVAGVQADPTSRLVAVCRPISGGDTVFPQSAEELVIIEGEAF